MYNVLKIFEWVAAVCVYGFLAAQNIFSVLLAANVLLRQSLSAGLKLWALDTVLAPVPNEVGDPGWGQWEW